MQFGFKRPSSFREDFKTTESEGPRTKVKTLNTGIDKSAFS